MNDLIIIFKLYKYKYAIVSQTPISIDSNITYMKTECSSQDLNYRMLYQKQNQHSSILTIPNSDMLSMKCSNFLQYRVQRKYRPSCLAGWLILTILQFSHLYSTNLPTYFLFVEIFLNYLRLTKCSIIY